MPSAPTGSRRYLTDLCAMFCLLSWHIPWIRVVKYLQWTAFLNPAFVQLLIIQFHSREDWIGCVKTCCPSSFGFLSFDCTVTTIIDKFNCIFLLTFILNTTIEHFWIQKHKKEVWLDNLIFHSCQPGGGVLGWNTLFI